MQIHEMKEPLAEWSDWFGSEPYPFSRDCCLHFVL